MEDKQQIQDKELKELFKGFRPELSSNDAFLRNLDRSLQSVDLVREHTRSLQRKNHISLAVAFVAGVFMGALLALVFPLIGQWTTSLTFSLPHIKVDTVVIDWRVIGWLLIAATCIFTAKNAYDITLYKLNAVRAPNKAMVE